MDTNVYTPFDQEQEQKPSAEFLQPKNIRDIVAKAYRLFDEARRNRDRAWPYFRERNWVEVLSDNKMRFNNYKLKPDWKEDWQSNISDITTHTKLMALTALAVQNRQVIERTPRFKRDIFSKVKASIFDTVDEYIGSVEHNVLLDTMFQAMVAFRDGTGFKYVGYRDAEYNPGCDVRFIPGDQVYLGDMTKFRMADQPRVFIRVIQQYDVFKASHTGSIWHNVDKVTPYSKTRNYDTDYFNAAGDLEEDQVEKLVLFDAVNDIYMVIANGILISRPKLKLTDIQKDRRIPIVKFDSNEPFDPNFAYSRSIVDLMRDNQDGIDLLFGSVFDRQLLSTMRPILVGSINDLDDDYWYPGAQKRVADVTQIKELGFDSTDMNAFRILKELQDRNAGASLDSFNQGVAQGRKTATEVERATQAQAIKNALYNVISNEAQLYEARLRNRIIQDYYLRNDKFERFVIEGARLTNGQVGTRIVKITKNIPPRNEFGYSPELAAENMMINGESEIIYMSEKEFKNFEVDVQMTLEPPKTKPVRQAIIRDYVNSRINIAMQRPDLLDPQKLLELEAEAIPGVSWEDIKSEGTPNGQQPVGTPMGSQPRLSQAPPGAPPNSPIETPQASLELI